MDLYEGEKYYTTPDNVKETLETYGVAVIPNLINNIECDEMVNGMWNYIETITKNFEKPITRGDPSSWSEYTKLWVKHSMLNQHWKIGHAQFIWQLRENPKVLDVFSKIWATRPENLLVSFDGASFHMPPEITKKGWFKGTTWLHCDQSFTRNSLECIQSWITGFDVNPGDATLAFYEGSHKYHEEFGKRFDLKNKDDWYKLETEEQANFYKVEKGCELHYIKCPAGSLVLWDSRTIHSGQEALKERPVHNFRCVAYLCYTPRSWATDALLRKKQKAFTELRTTNHWPHRPKLFPVLPRTYGAKIEPIADIEPPKVGAIGRRLSGF